MGTLARVLLIVDKYLLCEKQMPKRNKTFKEFLIEEMKNFEKCHIDTRV